MSVTTQISEMKHSMDVALGEVSRLELLLGDLPAQTADALAKVKFELMKVRASL